MRYAIVGGMLLATMGTLLWARTEPVQPPPPSSSRLPEKNAPQNAETKKPTVMQRKLTNAQKVLEGLAMNNFELVGKSADELMQCVKEVTWKINETEKYMLYTNEFIRDIEGLQKAAKKKNNDAATLAYVQMTLTCMKCHEMLRETRIGFNPEVPLFGPKAVAGE